MTSHSLSLRLLEYDIFILILAHLKKIPNGFYKENFRRPMWNENMGGLFLDRASAQKKPCKIWFQAV